MSIFSKAEVDSVVREDQVCVTKFVKCENGRSAVVKYLADDSLSNPRLDVVGKATDPKCATSVEGCSNPANCVGVRATIFGRRT